MRGCVYKREREREREREWSLRDDGRERMFLCVCERERDSRK